MASSNSFLLSKLSGHLGKQIVFKQYGDKTVVSKYPDMSRRKVTKKQLRNMALMEDSHYYAKKIVANESLRNAALLRLNVTRNKLYTSLIKEYFSNPTEPVSETTIAMLAKKIKKTQKRAR
jgi:hypothetical protein